MADALPNSKLARLARTDLDLAFRSRGEAALVRVAYYGRAISRAAFRTGGLLLGGSMIAAFIFPVFPRLGWVPGIVGLGGIALLMVAALTRVVGWVVAGPARTARAVRLQLWARVDGTDGADGARVLLRGRVVALRTVKTLDGRPAVFVRKRATRRGRGAELNEAEDFLVDDGSGSPARVAVQHALFVDRPAPVFGSWMGIPLEFFPFLPRGRTSTQLDEAVLAPGDAVEVIGRVETVVDPAASDRFGRETPLVRIFSGTADEPVLLRTARG
jgi:hypothetical protein